MNPQAALGQYQSVNQQGRIAASQNHGLVSLLLDRILERLAQASGAMERGDSAASGMAMSDAIRIVDNLRASLDSAQGGEIAASLGSLYDYIEKRMVLANSKSDQTILAEVVNLITEIKTGWDGISEAVQK
jgi:flagellar protein FliS